MYSSTVSWRKAGVGETCHHETAPNRVASSIIPQRAIRGTKSTIWNPPQCPETGYMRLNLIRHPRETAPRVKVEQKEKR